MERAARGDFRAEFGLYIEALGSEFLRVLQDEIIRRRVLDTRLLLASFERGGDGNVWNLTEGGLTLEVGTNLEYAAFVNDGHWTNPSGVALRWVPGYWEGYRFIYDPEATTGMALKQHWVEGALYGPLSLFLRPARRPNSGSGWGSILRGCRTWQRTSNWNRRQRA